MKLSTLIIFFTAVTTNCFALAPTVSSFLPTSAATGKTVTINGTNFTGATAVSFGGTPAASFIVVSATQITAVVAGGSSGSVSITTPGWPAGTKSGFYYLALSGIITDYAGYWASTTNSPNPVAPDNSHDLLAFTYNSITYSTGVNNSTLTSNGVTYTSGSFKAIPVAGVPGSTAGTSSTYIALAKYVDGDGSNGNASAVSSYSISKVLSDGLNGLDLGTGVTNLPVSAVFTFDISSINTTKISDAEPDIIMTQIADPSVGNDVFQFTDATGAVVGSAVTQNMVLLSTLGNYTLDLFNLSPNTPLNNATVYSLYQNNVSRTIRLVAFKLSDFNITAGNAASVKGLKITPSGNSDYAFVAYNANAITLPPLISINSSATNSSVCSAGTANLEVIAGATSGGSLTYSWEHSIDGGVTWTSVTDGGNVAGATTNRLSITSPANNDEYRAIVTESGSGGTNTSAVFTITIVTPAAPSAVTASGTTSVCINNATIITSTVTGGSNLYYQWQSNASGSYADIAGANLDTYEPPVNVAGVISYKLKVASGNGCASLTSTTVATITVNSLSVGGSIAGSATVCSGTNSTNLTLSGKTGSVLRWESSTDNFVTPVTIANTTNSLAATNLTATTEYRAVIQNGACALAYSSVATIIVNSSVGGVLTGGATVCSGTNSTTLTLSGNTGSIVKWQSSTDNFTSNIIDIANTTTGFTATNLIATTEYRAVIQNGGCASAYSNVTTVTVNPQSIGGSVNGSAAVCSGSNSTLLTLSGSTGTIIKWQSSTDNFTTVITDIANSTTSLTATNLSVPTQYRAVVQSGVCSASFSSIASITILSPGTWVGGASGNWNIAANWCGGIPPANADIVIPANATVLIQSADVTVHSLTINTNGNLVMQGSYHLNIAAGGSFINNGSFDASASTGAVSFSGNGIISGATTFKNIETRGALNFGAASTVAGNFTLETGGSVTGNAPLYTCPSSTLIYNTGGTFTRSMEWRPVSSGQGYPSNVTVQNSTTINFPAGGDGYICNDLTIGAGSGVYLDYAGGSAPLSVGRNVTINGAISLGGDFRGNVFLGGNWTRNAGGVFNHNQRAVTFTGTGNSIITAPGSPARDVNGAFGGETFFDLHFNKLINSASVTLASNISIMNEINFIGGIFDLMNSDITIVSNATSVAHVAPFPTASGVVTDVEIRYGGVAGTGSGKFVIQRYLPIGSTSSSRRWRLLTIPLSETDAPTISTAWQEGVSNADRNAPVNPWPGFGTTITKSTIYNAADGYDQGSTNNPSLYYFSGTGWGVLPSTNTFPVTDHEGYMLFARGNRGIVVSSPYINANATTLEPKGRISMGDVGKTLVAGFQPIGNPYASAIDFNKTSFNNYTIGGTTFNTSPGLPEGLGITYYIWDPETNGSNGVGKFITCSSNGDGTFLVTSNTGGVTADGTILSGTAFMLAADNSGGTLTFHEQDKIASGQTANRPISPAAPALIFTSGLYAGTGSAAKIADAVISAFGDYNNSVDGQDATSLSTFSTKESLSILRNGKSLSIERRNYITVNDTVFLAIKNLNVAAYSLRFKAINFETTLSAVLQDKFTGLSTPVSLQDSTDFTFNITSDSGSSAVDRFRIVFRPSGALPITAKNVKAFQQENNIAVQWTAENQSNITKYEIEKSPTGRYFTLVNTTDASSNQQSAITYNWLDVNALAGDNFYRIKFISINGTYEYSKIMKVTFENDKSLISVFPNPVTNGIISLQLNNIQEGHYDLRIIDKLGNIVSKTAITHDGSNASHTFTPQGILVSGSYKLEITGLDKKTRSVQVVVLRK